MNRFSLCALVATITSIVSTPATARYVNFEFTPGESFTLPTFDPSVERVEWGWFGLRGSAHHFHRSYGQDVPLPVMDYGMLSELTIHLELTDDTKIIGNGYAKAEASWSANIHSPMDTYIDFITDADIYGSGDLYESMSFYGPSLTINTIWSTWPDTNTEIDAWSDINLTKASGYLSVVPVPEASTWAMVMTGFVAVGNMLRIRRTKRKLSI